MEARAIHDFTATAEDELSFKKDNVLKIISKDDDQNWYKAEIDGKEGYVPYNYIEMKPHDWFMGKMKRSDAERLLLSKENSCPIHQDGAFLIRHSESTPGEFSMSVKWYVKGLTRSKAEEILQEKRGNVFVHSDGAFLVRSSESSPGGFSLSVKFGEEVQHFKVLKNERGQYFIWVVKFNSINELVNYHRQTSVSRSHTICLKNMTQKEEQVQMNRDHHNQFNPGPGQDEFMQQQMNRDRNQGNRGPGKEEKYKKIVTALYDFKPEEPNEVAFIKKQRIGVIEEVDCNWWKGRNLMTEEVGLFPAQYVS